MRVVVENLTGTLFYIKVRNDATVAELKREIEAQENLPRDRLILILDSVDHHNRSIHDSHGDGRLVSLTDQGVHDGSHIYIFFNPLDIHGPTQAGLALPGSPLW